MVLLTVVMMLCCSGVVVMTLCCCGDVDGALWREVCGRAGRGMEPEK